MLWDRFEDFLFSALIWRQRINPLSIFRSFFIFVDVNSAAWANTVSDEKGKDRYFQYLGAMMLGAAPPWELPPVPSLLVPVRGGTKLLNKSS